MVDRTKSDELASNECENTGYLTLEHKPITQLQEQERGIKIPCNNM